MRNQQQQRWDPPHKMSEDRIGGDGEFGGGKQGCQEEELHQRRIKQSIQAQEAHGPRCCNVLSAGHLHYAVLCVNLLLLSLAAHRHTQTNTVHSAFWASPTATCYRGSPSSRGRRQDPLSSSDSLCHTRQTSVNRKAHRFPTVRGWGQVCSSSSIIPKDSWDAAVVPQLCDSASVRWCQAPKCSLFLFSSVPPPTPCSVSLSSPLFLLPDPPAAEKGRQWRGLTLNYFLVIEYWFNLIKNSV